MSLTQPGYSRYLYHVTLAGFIHQPIIHPCTHTYMDPYASGSDCVESPMHTILRCGNQARTRRICPFLYASVSTVSAESRPDTVVQLLLLSRSMSWPAG